MRTVMFSVGLLILLVSVFHPQVVINEIMMDPGESSDSKGEWLELYNSSDSSINLEGWKLRDGGRDRHTIQTDSVFTILPGAFLTLGRSDDSTENGGYLPDYVYSHFILSNEEDEIVLVGSTDDVIDSVAYGSGWPVRQGASMELVSPGFDNADPASWGAAEAPFGHGDMGTPGHWNSISGLKIETGSVISERDVAVLSARPYPNPSSGLVKIQVSCTDSLFRGDYILEIFSLRGRLIERINSCCVQPGENLLNWEGLISSGEPAPAGVYLFRITVNSMTTGGKVVLIR